MSYIAVLDYENLDNGIFLQSFAEAISRHPQPGLILHGDSEYTERILQTGVMRDEATRRAMKDLNLRLVALLADAGVPAISMHGYHKDAICQDQSGTLHVRPEILSHPPGTAMVLSALTGWVSPDGVGEQISTRKKGEVGKDSLAPPVPVKLPVLASVLSEQLKIKQIILFSQAKNADFIKTDLPETISRQHDRMFLEQHISDAFIESDVPVCLATTERFGRFDDLPSLPRVTA